MEHLKPGLLAGVSRAAATDVTSYLRDDALWERNTHAYSSAESWVCDSVVLVAGPTFDASFQIRTTG